jgi:AraC-like DNA-binding protein
MPESQDSEAPPAVSVVEFSDPTIANHGYELVRQDAVQLQSTPLLVRRVIVRLGDANVVQHSVSSRVRARTTTQNGLLGYLTFDPKSTGTVNGLPVRPDLLLAVAPDTEINLVTEPGWNTIGFLLRPDCIAAHLSARQRAGEFGMPCGVETLQADAAIVQGLYAWGMRLVDAAVADPGLFNDSTDQRAAAQVELVEMLLATLDDASGRELGGKELAKHEQSRIVKIAEAHALARAGERLYVSDLCRVAAVSERTLEYAFKEILGLTPVAYLTRLRLHRVRQALRAASSETTTVSSVALDWGFWHFGEFSRAYKECFGELPSETLRAARAARVLMRPRK